MSAAVVHFVEMIEGGQRFLCGDAASKHWGRTDGKNVLHVASGEPERVSCPKCKAAPGFQGAVTLGTVGIPDSPEAARRAPDERAVVEGGAESPVAPAPTPDAAPTN